jgi:7,8-dihydropterin-6-yl-methyl-4-(beta-D-ribofuranosyl)aminobenzene 5'-phosphate synthase
VTIAKGERETRVPFDAGRTPDGLVENMRRLELWTTRRRLALPGRGPFELPTTGKRALEGAGVDFVEEREPSFVLDRALLVTGEVDRATGSSAAFPATRRTSAVRGARTR